MKKLLFVLIAAFTFSCGETSNQSNDESVGTQNSSDNDVEEFSGEHITPQVEADSATSRLDVDSISSAEEAEQAID